MKDYQSELEKNTILQKIRNNLWSKDGSSRVSTLVGAGFSRNAKKLDDNLKSMSLWSNLRDKMLEELGDEKNYKEAEVTELADIYKDKYGVVELEKMLKTEIPDDNYEPGSIHQSLLELPFSDIFTTNYDTLLERTVSHVYNRNYQIIADPRDITGSTSPRIVKLHGTFPSNRPFVFSKNDYDTYEEKSAPFVNMVRQSIMETTMILIGFSGDDPNFKNWIKWIEESLGEHSPKIYMLDLNITNVENHPMIVPIDLAEIFDRSLEGQRYEVFLTEFLKFLSEQPIKKPKNWPHISYSKIPKVKGFNKEIDKTESKEVIRMLRNNREQYPGWLVLPYKIYTKEHINYTVNDLEFRIKNIADNNIKSSLLYELLWIYKIWRIPLYSEIEKEIEDLVLQYDNPFEYFNKNQLITICIGLLREYKLDHKHEKFHSLLEKLNHLNLNTRQKNELNYQLYTYKFINGDYKNLSSLITLAYKDTDDFELKIKFAVLKLQIGEENEAIKWMKNLLNILRKIELLDSNNIRAFSSEGILLSHLRHKDRANFKQYNDRLLDLENLYCSPTTDLDKFTLFKEPNEQPSYEYSTFDNRTTVVNTSFSNNNRVYNNTNYLLSVRDDFYLGVSKDHKIKLLKYIFDLYPIYGLKLSITLLTTDKIKLEEVFSRSFLLNLGENDVDELYNYLKKIISSEEVIYNMKITYDIFYRLYMIVGEDKKREMELILHENYKTGKMLKQLENHGELVEKLYERILDYKFSESYVEFVEELLNYPLISEPNTDLNNIKLYPDHSFEPAFVAYKHKPMSYEAENIDVNPSLTDKLIEYFEYVTKDYLMQAAFKRLVFINSINGLLPNQKSKIKKILTKYLLENTLLLDDYNKLMFAKEFNLNEDVTNSLKKQFINKEIPKSYWKGGYSSSIAIDNYLMNISLLFLNDLLNQEEFNRILGNIYNWWEDQYKHYDIDALPFLNEGREFKRVILFLSDYVFNNKNININNPKPIEQLYSIFNELYEDDNNLFILLYPYALINNLQDTTIVLDNLESFLIDFDKNDSKEMDKFNYAMQAIYNIIRKEDLVHSEPLEKIVNKMVFLLSSLTKSTLNLVLNGLHEISKKRYNLLSNENIEWIISSFDNFYSKYVETERISNFKWIEQYNILYYILEISQVFYEKGYNFEFEKWISYMKKSEVPRLNAYSSELIKKCLKEISYNR